MGNGNKAEQSFTVGQWTRSTFLGWLLGIFLIISLSSLLDSMGIEGMQFYLGLGMGAGVGFLQWLHLRKFITASKRWIWFSVAGMGIPFIILDLLLPTTFVQKLPVGVALGAIVTGFLQFLILKDYSKQAHIWIWTSVIGWTVAVLAVLVVDYTKHLTPYVSSNLLLAFINLLLILSGGIILGLITGTALQSILKRSDVIPLEVAEQ
jgi:MFS family permease